MAIAVTLAPVATAALCAFIGYAALVGPVACSRTVRAEMLNSFAIAHIGVGDTPIAVIPSIGLGRRCAGEEEKAAECQSGERCLAENRAEKQSRKFHKSLQERPRAGFGMTS